MSRYTDLKADWFEHLDGTDRVTTKPVMWDVGRKESGLTVVVQTGFVFQFSVPWAFRWLFDPHDPRHLKASCLHDWLLAAERWDRTSSAAVFAEALRADGVSRWRRLLLFTAVALWHWT